MEETNVTMITEEMQGKPAAKENETKAEKFIRIGEYRMNKAVDAIGRLENLANRSSYEYTQEQVDAMFQALEGRVEEVKSRFEGGTLLVVFLDGTEIECKNEEE